ncbi:histidinol-phosphatase [Anaerobacillus alkalilacustris]|uniref:Histidinol-phosphatase n=1 Tax=Anaerobacillus alkalilacustris TaxID=393763 RepID=A0A1S2LXH4_9BACI|nr:histidinol-phosphatase HisJ family protein [Anaerobacillus alkalilacustris]OIJ16377.1 histidinol-phosphatase [Anaerobacillus alkalilacustris]
MYMLDFHHHTNHSFDSKAVMEDVCKNAITKGIKEICFTEHFSLNSQSPTNGHINLTNYFSDIKSCQEKFQDQLLIRKGLEICEPHLLKDLYCKTFEPLELDFILGSVHNINNRTLRETLEKKRLAGYKDYFQEVYEMVSIADIDVVAHLDLMKRYAYEEFGLYDFTEYREILEAILSKIIERNLGIEINTSGLRTSLNESLPSINIVKLYKELGGEILTVGSDSHSPDSVGSFIKEAIEMAKECGFTYVFSFDKRKAIPHKI